MEFKNSMHAVVVTDMRLFYIRLGLRRRVPGPAMCLPDAPPGLKL